MTYLEKRRTEVLKHVSEGYCYDIDANCDECPPSISKHCKIKETEGAEAKAPKDATEDVPKGWIKLKITNSAIYIDASKIVGLSQNPSNAKVTEVYTIGGEDSPWLVDDSVDEIIEKIKKALDTRRRH